METIFWLGALLLLNRGYTWWLVPLVFLATLNRETSVFIVLLAGLVTRDWKLVAVLGLVWAVTYSAIRLFYGPAELALTIAEVWYLNMTPSRFWHFVLGVVLLSWLPFQAMRGYRQVPLMLRRAAWTAPPIWGWWPSSVSGASSGCCCRYSDW